MWGAGRAISLQPTRPPVAEVFDPHNCILGEGPLWHPERGELFWFDIIGKELRTRDRFWRFDDYVSAAGWVDRETLLIASSRALSRFDIDTGAAEPLVELEAGNPLTRSNDGRADPWGGFWIGTMGVKLEPEAGAIYRFHRGELRTLFERITVPNAICFAPDRSTAYWCDTERQQIMRQPLAPGDGWPLGPSEVLIDLTGTDYRPDGAVTDAEGNIWNAQWGAGRVACYGPDGRFKSAVEVGGRQSSCPAFGGADFSTLFVTTAAEGLDGAEEGRTYRATTAGRGRPEYRVIL
ncbi:MAG: SMP-30/gluconolactonase/LRE family protein [Pseudomonadota bacterium]